jgi:phospholipid/cholesterol/gamma-HCH transport system ATP-binding protein
VLFRGSRIDNLPERSLAEVRKHIGFLFQLSALFDSMTVEENLEFPLVEHTRLRPSERRRQVIEALEMVDLHGVEHKRPAELSGGQQKRAALARAVMLRPEVILYDEPTTGLDPTRADGINNLILKLQRELNVTSVVVTHDLHSAARVADRMVMLHAGTVLAQGTPEEIRASADPHVRKFLAGVHDPDEEEEAGERLPLPAARTTVAGATRRDD